MPLWHHTLAASDQAWPNYSGTFLTYFYDIFSFYFPALLHVQGNQDWCTCPKVLWYPRGTLSFKKYWFYFYLYCFSSERTFLSCIPDIASPFVTKDPLNFEAASQFICLRDTISIKYKNAGMGITPIWTCTQIDKNRVVHYSFLTSLSLLVSGILDANSAFFFMFLPVFVDLQLRYCSDFSFLLWHNEGNKGVLRFLIRIWTSKTQFIFSSTFQFTFHF